MRFVNEVFVKIQKKNWGGGGPPRGVGLKGGLGGGVSGRGGVGLLGSERMWTKNWSFCENFKKKTFGGDGG